MNSKFFLKLQTIIVLGLLGFAFTGCSSDTASRATKCIGSVLVGKSCG